ncbi:MAG: diguanylate cyclase [Dokdonella sp.]|uniref:GGDEF domain-containing protein n=1 Tax=Dokdonella sp. TaxID=2291710 RepID=UPI0025BDB1FC|nr:GGDEF domain-containing protein [Dokdonella sp.]MBX3702066.1 diguanylate cyclase [Dokdonella sp.]MCW5579064.1 diguanylate cyclase [Dokdonella sp.]
MHSSDPPPDLATTQFHTDRIDGGCDECASGACLVVLQGQLLGQRLDLDEREVVLGRDSDCGFHIEERSVSRRHARIWRDAGGYRIRDLGSTNGIRLNEQPVTEAALQDGDCIAIGSCVLKFMQRSSVEARYHEEIYQLATRDALTGLCNRRLFLELIERELQRSAQYGHPLALLIVDLDHFKAINDTHGHVHGDRVLEQVGAALHAVAGDHALAARIGGEEFAIALPEHDRAAARDFAERVRASVAALPLQLGERTHTVTVSVGVGIWQAGMHTVGALLAAADRALYRAKASGRNRVEVDS